MSSTMWMLQSGFLQLNLGYAGQKGDMGRVETKSLNGNGKVQRAIHATTIYKAAPTYQVSCLYQYFSIALSETEIFCTYLHCSVSTMLAINHFGMSGTTQHLNFDCLVTHG